MTTVPRMWTLAIAALLGIELPDDTPKAFRYHRDIPTLTDHDLPPLREAQERVAALFAEETVEDVKELLFPKFGLS